MLSSDLSDWLNSRSRRLPFADTPALDLPYIFKQGSEHGGILTVIDQQTLCVTYCRVVKDDDSPEPAMKLTRTEKHKDIQRFWRDWDYYLKGRHVGEYSKAVLTSTPVGIDVYPDPDIPPDVVVGLPRPRGIEYAFSNDPRIRVFINGREWFPESGEFPDQPDDPSQRG